MTESYKGKIKFYDPNKGYGFICPEGSTSVMNYIQTRKVKLKQLILN